MQKRKKSMAHAETLTPRYPVGELGSYIDRHEREQVGRVKYIEGHNGTIATRR